MKNKIVKLNSGENYYVLEELDYENNKYVIGVMCDLEKEILTEEEYIIFQVNIKDDRLVLDDILDDNLAMIISNKMIEKIRNS